MFAVLRHLVSCLAWVVVGLLLPSWAGASTLILSNGDHVTGRVVKRADGKVYFQSDLLGDFLVPEGFVRVLETGSQSGAVPPLAANPPARPGTSTASAAAPAPTPPGERKSPKSVVKTHPPSWKGKLEFGYNNQESTVRTVNLALRAEMERRAERDDYLLKASYLYGISADQPNVERNEASFRWRHTLSRRTFAQSLTAYSADKIRLLNRRVEQNVGVGYRVFGSDRQTVNVGAGFSGLYLDAEGVKPGMGYLGNLFQDYTFIINERYTLVQDASLQYSPETPGGSVYVAGTKTSLYRSTQDHVVGLHSTLQEKINSRLSLNFRFGYEYDSAIPDPSARGDERITTTLGVNF